MIKKIRSKKITTIVAMLGILAMIFQFTLGSLSILGLEKVSGYYEEAIEMNNWKSEILNVNQEFKQMKSDIIDFSYSHNIKNVSDVGERIKEMSSFFSDNSQNTGLDKEEQEIFDKLNNSFGEFSSYMESKLALIQKFKGNMNANAPNPGENPGEVKSYNGSLNFDKFNEMTELVEEDFEELTEYITNKTTARRRLCNTWLKNSKVFYSGVILIGFVIFGSIMIGVIKIIKMEGKEVIEMLGEIADGNLGVNIEHYGNNEFEVIKRELKNTVDSFKVMISSVSDLSGKVNNKSEELKNISHDLRENSNNIFIAADEVTNGTSEQANDLININNTIDGFSEMIEGFLQNINIINGKSSEISNDAHKSNEKMDNLIKNFKYIEENFASLVSKINTLGNNITRINDITNLIDSIAEQTNLLALNAAIEAARAGEGGKGFAVVAEEVRKLAEQSMISANDITKVISEISADTEGIVNASDDVSNRLKSSLSVIEESISSFESIVASVEEVVPKIQELTEASVSIGKEKESLVSMIENASAIAEEVSASTEEISASIKEMNNLSEVVGESADSLTVVTEELEGAISKFEI